MIVENLDLDRAVAEGIVSQDQALQLLELSRQSAGELIDAPEERSGLPAQVSQIHNEPFRLVKGFRDVFISLALLLFAIGLSFVAGRTVGFAFLGNEPSPVTFAAPFGLVLSAFLMAEIVTRSRRLPLSSAVLVLMIGIWGGWVGISLMTAVTPLSSIGDLNWIRTPYPWAGLIGLLTSLSLFYARHRFPFTLLPIALSVVCMILLCFSALMGVEWLERHAVVLAGGFGLVAFVIAMWFDSLDRLRVTRLSECAFWLHLLAAPLIVHTVIGRGDLAPTAVLSVMGVLCIVAIIIDRRALLVTGFGYLATAVGQLLAAQSFFNAAMGTVATLTILGGFLLLLGLCWTPIRRFVLQWLPLGPLQRIVPPIAEA